jgi:replication factor C subunit 1
MNNNILYEKYRPQRLADFIGNEEVVSELKKWMENFNSPQKSRNYYANLLLIGGPGIGKTTLAKILLEYFGYEVVEFNASDTRNAEQIDNIFKELFHNNTNIFSLLEEKSKKIAVIMDEIDGLTIGDKGGMKRLQYYLSKNSYKLPIILTSNISQYTCNGSKKLLELKKMCHVHTLNLPNKHALFNYIQKIVKLENLEEIITPPFIQIIISKAQNDFRTIFNTISMIVLLSKSQDIDISDLMGYVENNGRNVSYDVYQACDMIFNSKNMDIDTLFYLFGLERYNLPITLYDNMYNYINKFTDDNIKIINTMLRNYVFSIVFENALYNDLEWEFFDYQCSLTVISVYLLNKLIKTRGVFKVKNSKLLGKINSINANVETRIKISNKINIYNNNYHYYVELLLNEILANPFEFKAILDKHDICKEELLRMIKSADCKNRIVLQLKEIGIITQKELERIR